MREIRKQIYENFNQTIKQIEPIEFLNSTAKEQTDKNIEEFKKKLSDHATEIKQLTGFKEELEKIKMLLSMETKQKEELIAKNRELETSYTSETKELNNKIDSLNQYLENTCTELKTRNEAKTKLEEEIERLNERLTFGLDDKEELNSSRRKLVEKNKELETSNQELKLIIQEREKELLLVKQETEKIKENLKNIQNIDTKLKLAEEEATYWKKKKINSFDPNLYDFELVENVKIAKPFLTEKGLHKTYSLLEDATKNLVEVYSAVEINNPDHTVINKLKNQYRRLSIKIIKYESAGRNTSELQNWKNEREEIKKRRDGFLSCNNILSKQAELVKSWSDWKDYLVIEKVKRKDLEGIEREKEDYKWVN